LAVWVLNPFVAVISMRGSAESIICVLILATLEAVRTNSRVSPILFGLSVHFKIFPIIYALPIWLNIPYGKRGLKSKYFWSWDRTTFGLLSAGTFLGLAAVFYIM
jgi:phosphatidylinositol glycan class M